MLETAAQHARFFTLLDYDRDRIREHLQHEFPGCDADTLLDEAEAHRAENRQQLSDDLDDEAIRKEHDLDA